MWQLFLHVLGVLMDWIFLILPDFSWTGLVLLGLLSLLKIAGIGWHAYLAWRDAPQITEEFSSTIQRWKESEVRQDEYDQLFGKHKLLFRFEEWPEFRAARKLRIPQSLVSKVFYVPTLTISWAAVALVACQTSVWVRYASQALLIGMVWSYALQLFFMRLFLGPYDYYFRYMSHSRQTVDARKVLVPRHRIVADYMKVFVSLLMLVIGAYAIVYYSMSQIDPSSFCDAFYEKCEKQPALTLVRAVYFASVTFATVGFGDIRPQSPWATGAVTSEIWLAFMLVALVLMIFSITADD